MNIQRLANLCFRVATLGLAGIAAAQADDWFGGKLLALGDSVAFGYIANAGYEYVNQENFLGYPSFVGHALGLQVVNAACPGETTGSFLSSSARDNGCRAYRAAPFPLHVTYSSTQLAFATSYLKSHRDVRLITITLGANDGFLLEAACVAAGQTSPEALLACVTAGLPQIALNLGTILADLRAAGYDGPIIVANYYSTDYTPTAAGGAATALSVALNKTISAGVAGDADTTVADLFSAFEKAAVPLDGVAVPAMTSDTCIAGLLNVTNPNSSVPVTCDVHPTLSGQHLIADTIVTRWWELPRQHR